MIAGDESVIARQGWVRWDVYRGSPGDHEMVAGLDEEEPVVIQGN